MTYYNFIYMECLSLQELKDIMVDLDPTDVDVRIETCETHHYYNLAVYGLLPITLHDPDTDGEMDSDELWSGNQLYESMKKDFQENHE